MAAMDHTVPGATEGSLAVADARYIPTQQTTVALAVTGATMLLGLVYWALYLYPRRGTAWEMRLPVLDTKAGP